MKKENGLNVESQNGQLLPRLPNNRNKSIIKGSLTKHRFHIIKKKNFVAKNDHKNTQKVKTHNKKPLKNANTKQSQLFFHKNSCSFITSSWEMKFKFHRTRFQWEEERWSDKTETVGQERTERGEQHRKIDDFPSLPSFWLCGATVFAVVKHRNYWNSMTTRDGDDGLFGEVIRSKFFQVEGWKTSVKEKSGNSKDHLRHLSQNSAFVVVFWLLL